MATSDKKMNVFQLTIATIINMMGDGIILLPTNLAQVGTMSVLTWIVSAIGGMALAYAFSQAGMYTTKQDGMGGYAEYAYGKGGSFIANYTYGISLLIADVAIAISVVGYISVLFQWHFSPIETAIATILILWFATVLNFGGAKITGELSILNIIGIVLPIIIVSTAGWFFFKGNLYITNWNPHDYGFFKGISKSIPITLWGFLGLETASANMDEVKNPKRSVPIAVMCATAASAIMYMVSSNVILGIMPDAKLAHSNAPFGLIFSDMFSPLAGKIVMALMIISCFGGLLDSQCTIADVFKSSSIAGYFPKIFKRILKSGTPAVGMDIITVVQSVLALSTISPTLFKQFMILVNLAVVTNLVPYLLSMGALKSMQIIENVPRHKRPFTNAMALVASIYSLYALYTAGRTALMAGALVTFAGWTLYGMISQRFITTSGSTPKAK